MANEEAAEFGDADGGDGQGNYEVGYCKPPKHSRWPKGQSGNPKGREKGSRGLKTDLLAALNGVMTIRINGEPVKGTRQRLYVRALATRAATGDLKAAQILGPMIVQVLGVEDRGVGKKQLCAEDQAILDAFLSMPLHAQHQPELGSIDDTVAPFGGRQRQGWREQ